SIETQLSEDRVKGLFHLNILIRPPRRAAIVLKPALLNFYHAYVRRKYQLLFSPKRRAKVCASFCTSTMNISSFSDFRTFCNTAFRLFVDKDRLRIPLRILERGILEIRIQMLIDEVFDQVATGRFRADFDNVASDV